MNEFLLLDGQPFRLSVPALSEEEQVALPLEALEHGAYYAGKLGVTPAVARWHAKKRRFGVTREKPP